MAKTDETSSVSPPQLKNGTQPSGWREWFIQAFAIWLSDKGVSTVLLFLLILLLAWVSWYTVDTAIPAHLKQIQMGYESISKQNAESVEKITHSFDKAVDKMDAARDKDRESIQKMYERLREQRLMDRLGEGKGNGA